MTLDRRTEREIVDSQHDVEHLTAFAFTRPGAERRLKIGRVAIGDSDQRLGGFRRAIRKCFVAGGITGQQVDLAVSRHLDE